MQLDDIRPEDLRLEKTDNAREVLAKARVGIMSMSERRILILTDGQRSLADMVSILGKDIIPTVHDLIRRGFLAQVASSPPVAEADTGEEPFDFGDRLSHLLRSAALPRYTRKKQVPVEPAPVPEKETVPASSLRSDDIAVRSGRSVENGPMLKEITPRSMISAKTHAIDMLSLNDDARLCACADALRRARGESNVVDAILAAIRTLREIDEPGMLAEAIMLLDPLMPEAYLSALHAAAEGRIDH